MPTNYVEAARWYLKAAEKGDAYSQKRLGFMYETGQGVQTDLTEAAKWYRTAKDNGLPLTQRDLYRVLYKDQTPQWRFRDNPTVRGKSYASDGGVTIQLYPVDNKPRFLLVGLLFNFEPEEHQLKRSFVVTTTNNDFVCGDPSFSIFNHTEDETLVLLTFDNTAGWNVDKEYRLHGLSQSSSFTPTEDK